MAENRYRRGPFRSGQPLVGSGFYIADERTKCKPAKCDRNCRWPLCSREYYVFHRKELADAKAEQLKLLGHTVTEDED